MFLSKALKRGAYKQTFAVYTQPNIRYVIFASGCPFACEALRSKMYAIMNGKYKIVTMWRAIGCSQIEMELL